MEIEILPINHKIKHLEPIFSIHSTEGFIATSGMNGEMKLWDFNLDEKKYILIKCFKRHTGSVTSVRFSSDGQFLASAGDDGKVILFKRQRDFQNGEYAGKGKKMNNTDIYSDIFEKVSQIKHNSDVTHVDFTNTHLLSTDLDGTLIFTNLSDYKVSGRNCDQVASISGLVVSPTNRQIFVTSSDERICLYENQALTRFIDLEKGVIVENVNSRLSFSPNGKYFSVGLQFNNKKHSVNIYNLNLEMVYSLIGHVAPIEVTAFNPKSFNILDPQNKEITEINVIAIASQDNSISIWTTINPKPFVLIKNFSNAPALDMFWSGTNLFVSTYDGMVKKIHFPAAFFGEPMGEVDVSYDLYFSYKNMELAKVDSTDFQEIPSLQRKRLKSHINIGNEVVIIDKDNVENSISDDDSSNVNKGKQENCENNIKLDNIENNTGIYQNTNSSDCVASDLKIPEGFTDKPTDLTTNNHSSTGIIPHISKASASKTPVRIKPVCISKSASHSSSSKKDNSGTVVLFDTKIPIKLKLEKVEPFTMVVDSKIRIEYKCDETISFYDLSIYRNNILFYSFDMPINKLCYNSHFLVIYSTYLQIYNISTGVLIYPFIFYDLTFMDLFYNKLLVVNSQGEFNLYEIYSKSVVHNGNKFVAGLSPKNIYDMFQRKDLDMINNTTILQSNSLRDKDPLDRPNCTMNKQSLNNFQMRLVRNGSLPKLDGLIKVEVHSSTTLLVEYSTGEIFYLKDNLWLVLNPTFNSINSSTIDENLKDQTIDEIECLFQIYKNMESERVLQKVKNSYANSNLDDSILSRIMSICKSLVGIIKRDNNLGSSMEFKAEMIFDYLIELGAKKEQIRIFLAELNQIQPAQYFVTRMATKYKI